MTCKREQVFDCIVIAMSQLSNPGGITGQANTMPGPNMSILSQRDVYDLLQNRLDDQDISNLRAASKDCKECVDSTLARLKPVNLDCRLLRSRVLPGLKSLHISRLQHLQATQLQRLSSLTQLTQLHIAGPACSALRSSQLACIGHLTNLRQLSVSKCTKVRMDVLSLWHSLTCLEQLTLVGVTFSAADARHLPRFLSAGTAASLTSLVLGDQQGLNFLSDDALEGLGQLLGPEGRLQVLDLSGCIELTDEGFKHLDGLSSLQSLQLANCMKTGAGALQQVAKMTQLTNLNLRGCSQLHDTHLQTLLQHLTNLQTLNLQACSGLNGSCLSKVDVISRLVNLSTLNLAYCPGLYPSHLQHMTALPALKQLDMTGGSAVTGVDVLLLLGQLKHVTQLIGSHWRCKGAVTSLPASVGSSSSSSVTDPAGAAAAGDVACPPLLPRQMEHCVISHLTCSDTFLAALISSLPKTLTHLDLSSCTASGLTQGSICLKGLARCSNLRSLNLSGGSGKLDQSVLEHLGQLTALTELRMDRIGGCRVSEGVTAMTASWDSPTAAASSSKSTTSSSSSDGRGDGGDAGELAGSSTCLNSSNSYSSSSGSSSTAALGVATLPAGLPLAGSPSKLMLQDRSSSIPLKCSAVVRRSLFPGAAPQAESTWVQCLDGESQQQQQVQLHLQQQQQQPPRFTYMQQLQHLALSFSSYVTDQVLTDLSGLTQLASLELIACHGFIGSGFASWTLMTGLTNLNLSGCSGLRDEGLTALAGCCLGLKSLSLAGCKEVTDEGFMALQQLWGLRQLNMASSRLITSRSLAALFPRLHQCSQLGLSLCSSIDDDALYHLGLGPSLTAVDLRGCWKITDQGVRALLCCSPSLLTVNVDSCHRLSGDCCTQQFMMTGQDVLSTHLGSPNSSGSRRPGTLLRVSMPQIKKPAAATAGEEHSYQANFEATATEANQPCSMMSESSGSSSGSGCLELSALQNALQQQ